MAEFENVMAAFTGMCKHMNRECIERNCPLALKGFCEKPVYYYTREDIQEVEEIITKWVAEHPEPEYPTWAEYLNSIGVTISDRPFPAPNIPVYVYQAGAKMFEPIPADIAEKLGIEPKR